MIITVLAENTSISDDFGSEHGLSLYIKTNTRKILFDVGASNLFLENAKKLNVDVSDIDYLIISHGHYDHGGGLKAFLRENKKSEVFLHRLAFGKYYALRSNNELEYIGLDRKLRTNRQIVLTSDRFFISNGIQVLSNINQKTPLPISNSCLLMEQNGQTLQDTFAHAKTHYRGGRKDALVTGCP